MTFQGGSSTACAVENFVVRNCLIEYCGMGSFEYWLGSAGTAENVLLQNNVMRYSGYGFGGEQRPTLTQTAHIESNDAYNFVTNFRIENNIFDRGVSRLIKVTSQIEMYPSFLGNIYIQTVGEALGCYDTADDVTFNEETLAVLKGDWGDKEAVVVF